MKTLTMFALLILALSPTASANELLQCSNCFSVDVYHDEMNPDFKPYRITMDSVGVRRTIIYRRSASEDFDYYMNRVPKVIRDIAPIKAMRLARELQNSDRGVYPGHEEQNYKKLDDKLRIIKTNQFFINQKIDETTRRLQYGM